MRDTVWRETARPEHKDTSYQPPIAASQIIPKGWKADPQSAAFAADTVWEKDQAVKMRDGVKIMVDIFRPYQKAQMKLPALICWSPYGKSACHTGGFDPLRMIPGRVGVPEVRLSGFQKFEAPDPAEWIARGYAIVNPDPRGTYDSEQNLGHFTKQDAEDGFDLVEHVANLEWCDGNVGTVGNSWLAMAQWHIAAAQPPHLRCIAPLEGASDLYREILCRDGVPHPAFWDFLSAELRGRNKQEDVIKMLQGVTAYDGYWQDKRVDMTRIQVPAYTLASFSSMLHTFGSFRGFMEILHEQKWLRVHSTQEWHDLYQPSTNEDLQRFFDCFLKGKRNGWQVTSKVRYSILRFNQEPLVELPFTSYPLPATAHKTLYLDASQGALENSVVQRTCTVSYQADVPIKQLGSDAEEVMFSHTFTQHTIVAGCAKVTLFVSCPPIMHAEEEGEIDVHVQLRKADRQGNLLLNHNIPLRDRQGTNTPEPVPLTNPNIYLGPCGCLRARFRKVTGYTADGHPEHDLTHPNDIQWDQILSDGTKVAKLEIGFWQTGIAFEPGEKIVLKVSGHEMTLAEFELLRNGQPNYNKGKHVVYTGGETASALTLPVVDVEHGAEV